MVGGCGFVVAGGDGAVLFEALEAAFDHVAASVGVRVERGWAACGLAAAVSVGLLVGTFGNGRGDAAAAQVCTDGAAAVALVCQYSAGPGQGRPWPGRGIRIPASTWVNTVQSLTLPAVNTTDNGRPRLSQARWILVVGPPRDRPIA